MDEAGHKAVIAKTIKVAGGYARRIEDQYAVGILDMVVILPNSTITFFAEFKMVRGLSFGMTPKQHDEAKTITNAHNPHARAVLVGIKDRVLYFSYPSEKTSIKDAILSGPRKDVVSLFEQLAEIMK